MIVSFAIEGFFNQMYKYNVQEIILGVCFEN